MRAAARAHTMVQARGGQAGPAPAALPRPVIGVVFAGSGPLRAEVGDRRVRRSRHVDLGVDTQCRRIVHRVGQAFPWEPLPPRRTVLATFMAHGSPSYFKKYLRSGSFPFVSW